MSTDRWWTSCESKWTETDTGRVGQGGEGWIESERTGVRMYVETGRIGSRLDCDERRGLTGISRGRCLN